MMIVQFKLTRFHSFFSRNVYVETDVNGNLENENLNNGNPKRIL